MISLSFFYEKNIIVKSLVRMFFHLFITINFPVRHDFRQKKKSHSGPSTIKVIVYYIDTTRPASYHSEKQYLAQ